MAFRIIFTNLTKHLKPQTSPTHLFSTLTSPAQSFRSIKSTIKSHRDPEKIAQLITSPSPVATFRRHRPLLRLAVLKLHRYNRPELIEKVINSVVASVSHDQLNSETFWTYIVVLYGEIGMIGNAHKVFDEMLERRETCSVSEKAVCAMLEVYLRNGVYDSRFQRVFSEVKEKVGVRVGVKSYNLVMRAFCEGGEIGLARKLVEKMESEEGLVPDIESYNVLLEAYLEKGGTSGFDWVVSEVLSRGLEGNLVTYNCRIMRLCKSKEVVKARELLEEMVRKGVKPNADSYNTIILWFCKVGDLESAKKVLERMVKDGYVLQPSIGYFILLRGMVEAGEFEAGVETCREILKKNWIPPFETMKGLISGLVQMSKVEAAKEVVEVMKKKLRGSAADSWKKLEATLPLPLVNKDTL
ncbi:small ribosomal subunit protein mL103 (rPPR7)-like [Apium graveolens]|uniref:small ribosomal subunit protein mL103 (rPPR7)-like n=1 Tax=Apium graveolens TaxID=4045 RepID=UPI003D7A1B13